MSRPSVPAIRYVPATLASALLIGGLLIAGPRVGESACYGFFAKAKGAPPASTTTVVVAADAGTGAMDAATLARLTASILERDPSVVAVGPAGAYDSAALEALDDEPLPEGPLVISHVFSRFRPWTFPENGPPAYPPVLAHSLYPALDGPEPSLRLPMGEDLDLSDTTITNASAPSGAVTTGFSAPAAAGAAWTLPAFARLERGVTAALGVEAARRYLGVPASKVGYVEGVGALFNASHVLPIDESGAAMPRFHSADGLARIPASRFLEGRVSATEVQGKIVFVDPGAGAPLNTTVGPRTQTEAQASLAAGLLEGTLISAPSWGSGLAMVAGVLAAALIAVALISGLGGIPAFALALLLVAAYPVVALVAYVKGSLWLPPQLPPLLVLSAYVPLALTRLFAPRSARAPAIQPAPAHDPALVSLGRPAAQAVTPLRGTPQVAAAAPRAAVAEAPDARPRVQPPRERQGAPLERPAPQERPAPEERPAPHERIAPAAAAPEARPAPSRFVDPRDPPVMPAVSAAATVDLKPAPAAPRPLSAAAPVQPAPAAAPQPPPAGPSDGIERDAKGGLIRVGKYRIVRKMGFGSAGDVFEGFDTQMGRKVAIKTITKNAAALFDRASERFVLEAKAAGSLNHPCINTIYDFGTIRDVSYMVLEFLDGITLSQWMRANPQPPRPRDIAPWMQQIASALDYAHGHKIIHRDLKPANLMVVNNGATLKLLDFGIAKMDDVGLTQTGMTVGTPSYMSPEQLSGVKVGPASDQYGFAVVLYQLFTYRLPYVGTKIPELCNRILKNEIVPIEELNPALGGPFWAALRKAMSKEPEERYPDCASLYEALTEAMPA